MIDTAPAYTEPLIVAPQGAEEAHREWSMMQAVSEYCYRERSRARMLQALKITLAEHDILVIDMQCWKARERRWWN